MGKGIVAGILQTAQDQGIKNEFDFNNFKAELKNCAPRSLTGLTDPESRRLSAPTLSVGTTAIVVAGQSASVQNHVQQLPTSTVLSNVQAQLQSQGIAPPTRPSNGAPIGFDLCYSGQACYFNMYAEGKHYKVFNKKAGRSKAECATACLADSACEAFKVLARCGAFLLTLDERCM